jgi:uncharacterized repeat protein (TIGR01451 family)
LTKRALRVVDPDGGARVVPGARVTYELTVQVAGAGTAETVVVEDDLPGDLAYEPDTLDVSELPDGQEADDDFLPAGADNTGFDADRGRLRVHLGDLAGDQEPISIVFTTTIR